MKLKFCLSVFFLLLTLPVYCQNTRLNHRNSIGWYNYFGTLKLSKKIGLHTEYQWRRDDIIFNKKQSLLRTGINYNINPRTLVRGGYALIETYPYGEVPINALGRDFTEHRFFEMIQLSHKEGLIDFSQRFMLEQRLIGRYSSAEVKSEDDFPLLHRVRYMTRLQIPLKGREIEDKTPYIAAYNEVFVGFGKNVNVNIFDQNRLGLLLGLRINKNIRLEAGYLNQIIQFGRQINNKNVFQHNHGLILNSNFNIDLSK